MSKKLPHDEMLARRRERDKKYYLKNRDRRLAWQKSYHADNKEKVKKRQAKWYIQNKDVISAKYSKYYSKNRHNKLAKERFKRTGWTAEAFDAAIRIQGGRCGICGKMMQLTGKSNDSLAADHCHDTGKPRELLCSACNRGLGFFRDDPVVLELAANYLRRHGKR